MDGRKHSLKLGRVSKEVNNDLFYRFPVVIKDLSVVFKLIAIHWLDVLHNVIASIHTLGAVDSLLRSAVLNKGWYLLQVLVIKTVQSVRNYIHLSSLN